VTDRRISELNAAGALMGTELVPVDQSNVTVRTTTQAIANLGGGGGLSDIATFAYRLQVDAGSAQVTFTRLNATGATTSITDDKQFGSGTNDHLTINNTGFYFLTFALDAGSGFAFAPFYQFYINDAEDGATILEPVQQHLVPAASGAGSVSYSWMGVLTAHASSNIHGINVLSSTTTNISALSCLWIQRLS